MSKLAHSNQPTMDEIDRRRAIEDGNDDLIAAELEEVQILSSVDRLVQMNEFARLRKVYQEIGEKLPAKLQAAE